ncbi:MAG: GMC family oxidoreductase [Acidobacteriota bacterium]|nr:MAG: GMC family oxidoreductase [Acidobacteriota bacterium]
MRNETYDIVIIGSGAGGGTVAAALAPLCADGVRMAVLEWGAKLGPEDLTGRELEMARKLYVDGGAVLTRDGAITLAAGRAYGGSTVVYTGTSLPIPERVIERWSVPGLEWSDIDQRCRKYLAENNAHLLSEELINDNNRLFREGCERLGYRVAPFPINTHGCLGSGLCNLGCPNGAKRGTHVVQLPQAEAHGVEVITHCRVTSIDDRICRAVVTPPEHGEASRWEPGEYAVHARIVIVCAGALHTPALLLRSGLGSKLPALGRYLTLHPALILVGEHDRPIANFRGHPKSYWSDQFLDSHGFVLETCMYFPFTTAKNLIGFGEEHAELMRGFERLQMILVLANDPARAENRVTVDRDGHPVVDYTLTEGVLDALHASMKEAARIFFAAGARRIHAPAGVTFFIEARDEERLDELIPRSNVLPGRISITSAHIMGGCRMGREAATSVTDAWGRVHGFDGLFVADASLFPRCSEVNPYVTVMALADRVAERVRSDARELLSR